LSKQNPKSKSRKEPAKITEATAEGSVANVETPEKKTLIKERTPEEKQKEHREGIIKTIVAAALGIIAGILCFNLYGAGEDRIWYAVLMIVIGLTYFVQKLIYPQLKINTKEFKFKDWFYVEFIVLDFFLVIWTLLLN
jgi:predicted Co/Zn/Cd cation transporter (cation efflux family)